jgi:hypothetical protein
MENELQLVDDQQGRALRSAQADKEMGVSVNPYDNMLMIAVQAGNIDTIERMMALKERHEANEARKAFTAAKAAFKGEALNIVKDKYNTQFKSWYSSLGNIVSTVSPILSKHGLSADWQIEQAGNNITVTCVLSHALGHSESVPFTVPPDDTGAKNEIQKIKSSITYAKAVTFESVCGMASTDANSDDDGNASSGPKAAEVEKTKALPIMSAKKFANALVTVKKGEYTAEEIKQWYALNADQELELLVATKEAKAAQ